MDGLRTCFDHELELLGMRPILKVKRGEEIKRFTGRKFIRRVDVNLQHYSLSDSERTESDEVFALMGFCAACDSNSLLKFRDIFKGQAEQEEGVTLEYGNNRLSQSAGKQLAT